MQERIDVLQLWRKNFSVLMGLSWRHPGSAPPVSARASRVLLGRDPYRDPYLTLSPRLQPSFWADSRLGVCVYFINIRQVDLMSTFYCHIHTLTVCELKHLISTLSVMTTWPWWLSNINTVVSLFIPASAFITIDCKSDHQRLLSLNLWRLFW